MSLYSDDPPNIQRCRQREHKARKQDSRSRPFKLSCFPIVKIRRPQLHEEENGVGLQYILDN